MSVEGFYKVEVSHAGFVGRGVVILETQHVYGGDSEYGWVGTYRVDNGSIYGKVEVRFFGDRPYNIFGTTDKAYTCEMLGLVGDPLVGKIAANIPGTPALDIRLTKVAELP